MVSDGVPVFSAHGQRRKKYAYANHVCNGLEGRCGLHCKCNGHGRAKDWYGIYTVGWWIKPGVATELPLKVVVNIAILVKAWVWGPQHSEHLANGKQGVFHCASADQSAAAGCNLAAATLVCIE